MRRTPHPKHARDQLVPDRLPLDQGKRSEVAAVEMQKIDGDIEQFGGAAMAAEGFLQCAEVGYPLGGECGDLALKVGPPGTNAD